ncbi:MAG TPA: hypothetical protein VEH27_11650 [Methylomirabilota bacterium]|nr:hypothetical protein [Methylomirabilota bacterium]
MGGKILIAVVCLALGLVIGGFGRRPDVPVPNAQKVEPGDQPALVAPATTRARAVSASTRVAASSPVEVFRSIRMASNSRRWERLREAARSMPAGQEEAWILEAKQQLTRQEYQQFRQQALGAWAERDPQAALAFSSAMANAQERRSAVGVVLAGWAQNDAAGVAEWLRALPESADKGRWHASALPSIAESDPDLALSLLDNVQASERGGIRSQIVTALAERDPARAAELSLKSEDFGRRQGGALSGVLQRWSQQDPEAALAWIEGQPESLRRMPFFISALEQLGFNQPQMAMKFLQTQGSGERVVQARANVMQSWAQSDFEGYSQWMDSLTDPKEKQRAELAQAQALAHVDPRGAAEKLTAMKPDPQRIWMFQNVFHALGQEDPKAALALAMETKDPAARRQALSGALSGWAQIDPKGAAEQVATMPAGSAKNEAFSHIAQQWAQSDPQAAIQWVTALPANSIPKEMVRNLVFAMSDHSPAQAAELLTKLPGMGSRADVVGNLVGRWAQNDLASARKWAEELPMGKARTEALQQIGQTLAHQDPIAAAEYAEQLPAGRSRERVMRELGSSWASRDPDEALAFAGTIEDPANRAKFLESALSHLSHGNPEKAAEHVLKSKDLMGKESIVQNIASGWAQQDPEKALQWVEQLPEGRARQSALGNVLGALATQSPQAAAAHVAKLQGEELNRGVESVVSSMANSDPAYTASWVKDFPAGTARERAEAALIDRWANEDPTAAGAWLAQQPPGSNREMVVSRFSALAAQHDPQLAWEWANSMKGAMRDSTLENVAREWMRHDPAEARQRIQSSGVPDHILQRVLKTND